MNEVYGLSIKLLDCLLQDFFLIARLCAEIITPSDLVREDRSLPAKAGLTNVLLIIKVFLTLSRRESLF